MRLRFFALSCCVLALGLAVRGALAEDTPQAGQTSLGALLRGAPVRGDPDVEVLEALLAELRERPGDASTQRAVEQASGHVAEVRRLTARRSGAQELSSAKQVAWAALSLADRELARLDAELALDQVQALLAHTAPAVVPVAVPHVEQGDRPHIMALAPDFLVRADRAAADARAADGVVRKNHEARARLLLAAATTEASRVELVRITTGLRAQLHAAERTALAAEQAGFEARAEASRTRAATAAGEAAAQAFAEALRPAPQATEIARRGAPRAAAAVFFLERARLLLAAATALGAEPGALDAAGQRIDAAARPKRATGDVLAASLSAWGAATAALGSARGKLQAPTAEALADLTARLRELGLTLSPSSAGGVIHVPDAFVPAQPRLKLLFALLAGYPHGEVVLSAGAPKRAAAVSAQLVRALGSVGKARVRVASPVSSVAKGDELALTLPAYGMLPAQ